MVENNKQHERAIHRVLAAIEAIKSGGMVILTDDENRENEGDLVFAAQDVDAGKVNFMAKEARGLICLTLEPTIVERLQLPMMNDYGKNQTPMQTAFTVSIEAKRGVTTGISAADRAQTIAVAIDDKTTADDIVVPGHIFPLKAKKGGVLERTGHTEGSIDLAKLAGKKPAGVICEIMNDNGEMARLPDLEIFAKKFKLPLVSIEDLITFRLQNESLVEELGRRPFHTKSGTLEGVWFRNLVDHRVHFALVKGDPSEHCIEVRVHKQRPLEDVFGQDFTTISKNTTDTSLINYSLNMLKDYDHACVVYLMDDSIDDALTNLMNRKSKMMDPKLYGIGAQILKKLGISNMRIHVRSELSLKALGGFGLAIQGVEIINGK